MGTAPVESSFLSGANSDFIENLYSRFLANPGSVDESWQEFFCDIGDDLESVMAEARGASWQPAGGNGHYLLDDAFDFGIAGDRAAGHAQRAGIEDIRLATLDTIRALMLIRSYRVRGHLEADLDPLHQEPPQQHPELDPATYGFSEADMDRPIFLDNVLGMEEATMRQIMENVQRTYCGTLAVEYMHIQSPEQKAWIQQRIEGPDTEITFSLMGKKAILNKIIETEGFENYLNVKHTGTKRFGLDGGEAIIPAIEAVIKRGAQLGVQQIVIGMAHRGRLNMLCNVMGKPYRAVFSEFQGTPANPEDVQGSGDVKYHLGSSADREFGEHHVHLSLTANPSHLEAVNPVVLGKARAKIHQLGSLKEGAGKVLSMLLHGDAAFAGQGVIAECFGLSALKGYRTGGTVHFIHNNQIGFTTAPHFSRSSPYPSDSAKMVQAPIFHVNGDDPEAVVHAAKLAIEFRQRFEVDVVVDMFCYRRHGHNEGDEPAFTQPIMYKTIRQHPTTRQIYTDKLVKEGTLTAAEVQEMEQAYRTVLDQEFEAASGFKPNQADWLDGRWTGMQIAPTGARRGETAVDLKLLKRLGMKLTEVPDAHVVHRTIQRQLAAKKRMIETGEGVDWATAEALAFASLLEEGYPVRLSGQDSGRGTFSHRHSVLVDQDTEERYIPLANLSDNQASFEVIDSMLSEMAVLGFEYGYSMAEPKALVLWEAQFGDFANGAQVIIDQFICSGESKWLRMSGLVMLLPHGYEGQGPEHSSARLERYLQLCAEDNMQVVNLTTPANYFHALRRQVSRQFRKPLIVMSPKSLLRHKKCVSDLESFGTGWTFHRVLYEDHPPAPAKKIKRLVLCTGKIFYDLVEEREKRGVDDVHVMRVEQIYPYPTEALSMELKAFRHVDSVVWCQEEPKNMGAWFFVEPWLEEVFAEVGMKKASRARYAGRKPSASTATGLLRKHQAEQAQLLESALVG